ncbi:unnamed protein product [Pylaiella littoralis]
MRTKCNHVGCSKRASYGVAGTKTAELCSGHAKDGTVNVVSKMCNHRGCTKRPSFGVAGTKTAEFCSGHAKDGMMDVIHKRCTHRGCTKHSSFGMAGTKTAGLCSGHAKDGMMDVISKTCNQHGCTKRASFGVAGTKTAEFCSEHAKDGMMDVMNKTCKHRGCTKRASFGVAGTKTAEFCSGHAKDGMVNVKRKRCNHRGCTKRASYGVAGTKTAEFCSGHAKDGMVNVKDKKRCNKKCSHRGCTKLAKSSAVGKEQAEVCNEHVKGGIVDVVNERCAPPGCTTSPRVGVTGGIRTFCTRHAGDGMADLTVPNNRAGVHSSNSGGAQGHGGVAVEGDTAQRSGAGEKRRDRSPSSAQMETSPCRSKRSRQVAVHTYEPKTPLETAANGDHTPVGLGSLSEPENAGVKAEVAVSSKSDPARSSPFEAAAWVTSAENGSCGEPDGAVKREVGIPFPSKGAAAVGKLKSRRTKRVTGETRK